MYPISKAIFGKWYLRRIRWTLPDCQSIRGNQLYHTLSDWEPPPSPHTILDFLQVPPPWKISLENYSFFREPPFYVDRSTGCKKVIQIGILLCKKLNLIEALNPITEGKVWNFRFEWSVYLSTPVHWQFKGLHIWGVFQIDYFSPHDFFFCLQLSSSPSSWSDRMGWGAVLTSIWRTPLLLSPAITTHPLFPPMHSSHPPFKESGLLVHLRFFVLVGPFWNLPG